MSFWLCSGDSQGGNGTLHLWSPDSPYLYDLEVSLKAAENSKVGKPFPLPSSSPATLASIPTTADMNDCISALTFMLEALPAPCICFGPISPCGRLTERSECARRGSRIR